MHSKVCVRVGSVTTLWRVSVWTTERLQALAPTYSTWVGFVRAQAE